METGCCFQLLRWVTRFNCRALWSITPVGPGIEMHAIQLKSPLVSECWLPKSLVMSPPYMVGINLRFIYDLACHL